MTAVTVQRRAWLPPVAAGIVLEPRMAQDAADQARERGLPFVGALFDAAAASWQAALHTLGEERDKWNRAGAAAWCAASARSMEVGG